MSSTITLEDRGHVRLIGLNRPEKRNAITFDMLGVLAQAYTDLADAPHIRCGVLHAHGSMFTAGLDLADVAPRIAAGDSITAGARIDPWGLYAERCPKPMVVAVHGKCLTLGIELALAADIVVADETATFAQIEVARGIFPFGGATIRMAQAGGYQNAMRWLLTGDDFDAHEALHLGLVQEVMASEDLLPRAMALAERIARQAPLGVRATLMSARQARYEGETAAAQALPPMVKKLLTSEDAREGVRSMIEKRLGVFKGC